MKNLRIRFLSSLHFVLPLLVSYLLTFGLPLVLSLNAQALESRSSKGSISQWDETLSGLQNLTGPADPRLTTLAKFIKLHRAKLGVDGANELHLAVSQHLVKSKDGRVSVRFQQYVPTQVKPSSSLAPKPRDRIVIEGAEVLAIVSPGGELLSLDSGLVAPPKVEPKTFLGLAELQNLAIDQPEQQSFGWLFSQFAQQKSLAFINYLRLVLKTDINRSRLQKLAATHPDDQNPSATKTYEYRLLDWINKSESNFKRFFSQLSHRSILRFFF